MVVVVLAAQVVDVGGGDQRPAHLAGEADDPLVRLVLVGDAVLLHLEIDLVGAEGLQQIVEVGAGVLGPLLDQAPAEARLQAAGERDHPLGMARQQLHVDVRLPPREALEEAGRGELDQVAEAGVAGGQQGQVVALVADLLGDRAAIVDQVGLEPDDRLDPMLATGLVELDRAVHHPVVGEPEGRHSQLRRAGGHRVDLAGAVEQRVLAVGVQMGDGRGAHGQGAIMPSEARCHPPAAARPLRYLRAFGAATHRGSRIAGVIYLLRHGDAEDGEGDDAARRLTAKGERQARDAGRALAALGVEIEACLASPKVRAADTARIAAEAARRRGRDRPRRFAAGPSTRPSWRRGAARCSWSATSPTSPTRSPGSPAPA